MKPQSTAAKSVSKLIRKKTARAVPSRRKKRRLKRQSPKGVAERVTAVLDTHDAQRQPLRDAMRERFCQALLTANTATAAAVSAGYSPATARTQASRLLTLVDIQRRMAGLFENANHRSILRRRDVLKNASARASAGITDMADLLGLSCAEFAERIRHHPAAKAIKTVEQGVKYDAASGTWSPPFIKRLELFDPRGSERLLSDLLGWEAPKKLELVAGNKGRIMLPEQVALPVHEMPGVMPAAPEGDGAHAG